MTSTVIASGCEHPIQLVGRRTAVDSDGVMSSESAINAYAACKTRRKTRCEPCSIVYQHDARHLIAAGLKGGKGVDNDVADAPALFVTFTAPSFGAVHSERNQQTCRPRRDARTCEHGVSEACWRTHTEGDKQLGQPICADCYDYKGAVLWNNAASALWRITRINIGREIGAVLGVTERRGKALARSEYVKVVEFQQRGLVHFHVALRLDAFPAVAHILTDDRLQDIVTRAAKGASVSAADGSRITWGAQLDIRPIKPEEFDDERREVSRRQVANYLAKYATKGSDVEGKLDRRFHKEAELNYLNVNNHLARMVRTSWRLARRHSDARLDAWSHQLGYRGHFLTKSRHWSTTFKALRQVRKDHQEQARQSSWDALRPESIVFTKWDFLRSGYRTSQDAFIAEAIRTQGRRSEAA